MRSTLLFALMILSRPPPLDTTLYLPSTIPIPELSINDTDSRSNVSNLYPPLSSSASIASRICFELWWSISPASAAMSSSPHFSIVTFIFAHPPLSMNFTQFKPFFRKWAVERTLLRPKARSVCSGRLFNPYLPNAVAFHCYSQAAVFPASNPGAFWLVLSCCKNR